MGGVGIFAASRLIPHAHDLPVRWRVVLPCACPVPHTQVRVFWSRDTSSLLCLERNTDLSVKQFESTFTLAENEVRDGDHEARMHAPGHRSAPPPKLASALLLSLRRPAPLHTHTHTHTTSPLGPPSGTLHALTLAHAH